MGVSSCPMIGSYRPLRQTGKNSVCIRRIVCIRLSYQSGGCKSVESSFTGRALETSSKIEDCKGSPSLERGDGPATAARKEVLLQAKAGRQKDGRPLLPFFLFCYCCFLWQQQRGGREELGCWLVVGASGGVAARDGRRGRVKKVGRRGGARRNKRSVSRGSIACFCSSSSSFSSFSSSSSSSPSSSTSSSKKGRGASAS